MNRAALAAARIGITREATKMKLATAPEQMFEVRVNEVKHEGVEKRLVINMHRGAVTETGGIVMIRASGESFPRGLEEKKKALVGILGLSLTPEGYQLMFLPHRLFFRSKFGII